MRPVQYFSDEYLEHARKTSPDEVARFLDDFRKIHTGEGKSRLISLKVPEELLRSFRTRCGLEGVRYQTQIKQLMRDWMG